MNKASEKIQTGIIPQLTKNNNNSQKGTVSHSKVLSKKKVSSDEFSNNFTKIFKRESKKGEKQEEKKEYKLMGTIVSKKEWDEFWEHVSKKPIQPKEEAANNKNSNVEQGSTKPRVEPNVFTEKLYNRFKKFAKKPDYKTGELSGSLQEKPAYWVSRNPDGSEDTTILESGLNFEKLTKKALFSEKMKRLIRKREEKNKELQKLGKIDKNKSEFFDNSFKPIDPNPKIVFE